MNLVTINYDSTNYYLIQSNEGWIMVDTGWAGTFPKLLHLLKQKDIIVNEIKYLIITHFHPDHAGLVEEIKECGAKLIVHNCQVPYIGKLKDFFKPHDGYKDIDLSNNIILSSEDSRFFLKNLGIDGEIIETPGHSNDSVSLVIDGVGAFTGDLPGLHYLGEGCDSGIRDSWIRIKNYEVKNIYPGHGNSFSF